MAYSCPLPVGATYPTALKVYADKNRRDSYSIPTNPLTSN